MHLALVLVIENHHQELYLQRRQDLQISLILTILFYLEELIRLLSEDFEAQVNSYYCFVSIRTVEGGLYSAPL